MNDKKILESAFEKAKDNGYRLLGYEGNVEIAIAENGIDVYVEDCIEDFCGTYDLVFSHEFAKAFWGDGKFMIGDPQFELVEVVAWEYYLQEMVLEKHPTKYLKKFL